MFPWKRLADAGLALWFDEPRAAALRPGSRQSCRRSAGSNKGSAHLRYFVPLAGELDPATRDVLVSFQMRFRPARHDGEPDAETAAILAASTQP